MNDVEAFLRWSAALTLVTVTFLPFVSVFAEELGPARFGLTKVLGLATLTVIVWWPAGLFGLPFSRISLVFALIIVGVPSWYWWIKRGVDRRLLGSIIAFEVVWLFAFLAYAWFRSYNPDIIHTEKPMELALLTSTSRSSEVPAADPWLAGASINYYYFGYQAFATVIQLSGVPTTIAFNLALATIFASCVTVSAALGLAISRVFRFHRCWSAVAAILTPVFLIFLGNLEAPRRLLAEGHMTLYQGWWEGVGWQASRIISDADVNRLGEIRGTINEFPAFSFVLGDLHPHVMTYPLLGSIIALCVTISQGNSDYSKIRLFVVGGFIGILYASNSWDAPLGIILLLLALGERYRRCHRHIVTAFSISLLGAVVSALPFIVHFSPPIGISNDAVPDSVAGIPVVGYIVTTFGIVHWKPSSFYEITIVHGLWIAMFWIYCVAQCASHQDLFRFAQQYRHLMVSVILIGVGIALAWAPAVLLIGLPITIAAWFAWNSPRSEVRMTMAGYGVGFTLVLLPEFVFIQDAFQDRMNTMFKLYFQAWMILAVVSAGVLVDLARRSRSVARNAVLVIVGLVLAASLSYSPISAWHWSEGFSERRGLDGGRYLAGSAPSDYRAITWIATNAEPGDILVEAPGCSYIVVAGAPMARMSAFTGVPTVIGWYWHEQQWRRGHEYGERTFLDARVDYANLLLSGEMQALQSNVRFLILGGQEIRGGVDCGLIDERPRNVLQRLSAAGWRLAFVSDETRIFVPANDPLAPAP